jgi:HEAT repeat protein
MMCRRAAPDLRAAPVFMVLLGHPRVKPRAWAATGLGFLAVVPWDALLPLLDDKRAEVRAAICGIAATSCTRSAPWIMEGVALQRSSFPREALPRFVRALDDADPSVRSWAAHVLRDSGAVEFVGELERRAKTERVKAIRDVFRADAAQLRASRQAP